MKDLSGSLVFTPMVRSVAISFPLSHKIVMLPLKLCAATIGESLKSRISTRLSRLRMLRILSQLSAACAELTRTIANAGAIRILIMVRSTQQPALFRFQFFYGPRLRLPRSTRQAFANDETVFW